MCRFQGQNTIFSHLHPENPHFWGTYIMESLWQIFGKLFDLATWSTHKSFRVLGVGGRIVAPTLKFGTPPYAKLIYLLLHRSSKQWTKSYRTTQHSTIITNQERNLYTLYKLIKSKSKPNGKSLDNVLHSRQQNVSTFAV